MVSQKSRQSITQPETQQDHASKNEGATSSPATASKVKNSCEHLFKKKKLCGKIAWKETPKLNEFVAAALTFSDLEGKTFDQFSSDNFKAFIWMPGHSHGSSPLEIFKHAAELSIEDMLFTMPGAWELHVQWLDDHTQEVLDEVSWPVVI